MSDRANEVACWIQFETTWNADPTSGDAGATATPLETVEIALPKSMIENIPHQLMTGRPRQTKDHKGAKGATITFKTPCRGKASVAAVAANSSTIALDAESMLLENYMQARTTQVTRQCLAAGSTTTAVGVTAGTFAKTDIILLHELNLLSENRGQAARIATGASPYGVGPTLEIAATNATVAYAGEYFRPPVGGVKGQSITMVVRVGSKTWVLNGGRVKKMVAKGGAKGVVYWEVEVMFNYKTRAARASLPNHVPIATSELHLVNCIFKYGNTIYDIANFEFDPSAKQTEVLSTGAPQGRAQIENSYYEPKLKIQPLYQNVFEDALESGAIDTGYFMVGSGSVVAGVANTSVLWCEAVQIESCEDVNVEGILRQEVGVKICDPHYPTALATGGAQLGDYYVWARF